LEKPLDDIADNSKSRLKCCGTYSSVVFVIVAGSRAKEMRLRSPVASTSHEKHMFFAASLSNLRFLQDGPPAEPRWLPASLCEVSVPAKVQ